MSLILKIEFPNGDISLHISENRFELSCDFGVHAPLLLEDFIVDVENKFSEEGFLNKNEHQFQVLSDGNCICSKTSIGL